jgi:hypothetical protein
MILYSLYIFTLIQNVTYKSRMKICRHVSVTIFLKIFENFTLRHQTKITDVGSSLCWFQRGWIPLQKWRCFQSGIHAVLLPVVYRSCDIWYLYSDVESLAGCYGLPTDKFSVACWTNWIFMLLSWSHWEQMNQDGRLPSTIFKKIWQLFLLLLGNATSVKYVGDKGQEITVNWVWEVRDICPLPIWLIQDRQLSDNCTCRSP